MIRRGLHRHATRLAALALCLALYGFARLPTLSTAERAALASHFAFSRATLPVPEGLSPRSVRHVHPEMARIAGWISSVGAGVALADLDGDGLANDACWVDPRFDRAFVAPLPGTGERFAMFSLDPAPLSYDARTTAPMGCLPGDFNEDGLIDLLVYYWGRPPVVFLRRGVAGAEHPAAAAFEPVDIADPAERWYTNALTSADVDGDGHLDLVVGNYFPDGSRILDDHATDHEEMQRSMSHAANGGKDRLLLFSHATAGPQPTVAFRDVPDAFDPQTTHSWTLAIGAADLDGDMRPEIYFANDFGNDRLLHNLSTPGHPRFAVLHGERTWTAPRSKTLGRDSFKGMGIDFADLNGDGRPDIYVSNIAQDYALEENHFVWVSGPDFRRRMARGEAPYDDRSEPLGLARSAWSWDARFVDFDNDGVPEAVQATGFLHGKVDRWPELQELAMGNDNLLQALSCWPFFRPGDDLSGHAHDPFFARAPSGHYFDIAPELGFGMNQVSRGIAVADVDGDGRLDLAVANQWGDSYFYRNRSPHPGAFLGLDLRLPVATGQGGPGARAGRPAVGAEATVALPDGRRLVAQVDGGSGHSGKRAPTLHFGLGALAPGTVLPRLPVTVRWRSASGDLHVHTFHLAPGWHRLKLDTVDATSGKAV